MGDIGPFIRPLCYLNYDFSVEVENMFYLSRKNNSEGLKHEIKT